MEYLTTIGDCYHLTAVILLVGKMFYTKSCKGISARSQLLFCTVYIARYADIWLATGDSLYNFTLKFVLICSSLLAVDMIMVVYRKTYQHKKDVFPTEILLVLCFVLALFYSRGRYTTEILWTFSVYLEAVAILPQLLVIIISKKIEEIVMYYLIAFGLYGSFYFTNVVCQYYATGHLDEVSLYGGVTHIVVFVAAIIAFWWFGVKLTREGKREPSKGYLKTNIFFISNNEGMETTDVVRDVVVENEEEKGNAEIQKV